MKQEGYGLPDLNNQQVFYIESPEEELKSQKQIVPVNESLSNSSGSVEKSNSNIDNLSELAKSNSNVDTYTSNIYSTCLNELPKSTSSTSGPIKQGKKKEKPAEYGEFDL